MKHILFRRLSSLFCTRRGALSLRSLASQHFHLEIGFFASLAALLRTPCSPLFVIAAVWCVAVFRVCVISRSHACAFSPALATSSVSQNANGLAAERLETHNLNDNYFDRRERKGDEARRAMEVSPWSASGRLFALALGC